MLNRSDYVADPAFVQRLQSEVEGEVYFDALSRGRYSTDASMYQIFPIGVVVPRHAQDVVCSLQIAAENGVMTFYTGYWTTVAREIPFSFIQASSRNFVM